jgi:hypothetical protein
MMPKASAIRGRNQASNDYQDTQRIETTQVWQQSFAKHQRPAK